MLKIITTYTFICAFHFIISVTPAQAQSDADMYRQAIEEGTYVPYGYNQPASEPAPTLDIDNMYDPQYDPAPSPQPSYEPPRGANGQPSCPDGSQPVLGFCGSDIPSGY